MLWLSSITLPKTCNFVLGSAVPIPTLLACIVAFVLEFEKFATLETEAPLTANKKLLPIVDLSKPEKYPLPVIG